MSIHDRLAAVAEELHLSGFGSEVNEAVKRVSTFFADEIHKIGGAPAAAPTKPAGTAPDLPGLVTDTKDPSFKWQVTDNDGFVWQALADENNRVVEWICGGTAAQVAEREALAKAMWEGVKATVERQVDAKVEAKFNELLAKAAAADAAKTPAEPAAAT